MNEKWQEAWLLVEEKAVNILEEGQEAAIKRDKKAFDKAHKKYVDFLKKITEITGFDEDVVDKDFTKAWTERMKGDGHEQ